MLNKKLKNLEEKIKYSDGLITKSQEYLEELKTISQEIMKKDKLLYEFIEFLPDPAFIKDKDKKYIITNRAVRKKLLHADSNEECVGKDDKFFSDRIIEKGLRHDFCKLCNQSDQMVLDTLKQQVFLEAGYIAGEYAAFSVLKTPFYNSEGELVGVIGIGRDITQYEKEHDEICCIHTKIINLLKTMRSNHENKQCYLIDADFNSLDELIQRESEVIDRHINKARFEVK